MVTALAPRSQMVTEISPTNDPWQSSWYNWRENFEEEPQDGEGVQAGLARVLPVEAEDESENGCGNFRSLLCSESLGDIWEALLGRTASQTYVIDLWTQLLNPN